MENKQTQERIRQLVYRNLDSLFEELNELNESETNNDADKKREKKKQKFIPGQK